MTRLAVLAMVFALAACGTDAGIGGAASATLAPRVEAIRTAAANGDAVVAAQELAALRQSVAGLRAAGELSDDDAARVLTASAEVEAELAALAPSPTATTSVTVTTVATTSAPTTSSTAPAARPKEPKGKDKGEKDGDHDDEGADARD